MRIRLRYFLMLPLGGAVWGSLFGTLLGAIAGMIYGALVGDVTLGLDGAVLGCLVFAVLGAVYGAALALPRRHKPHDEPVETEWKPSTGGVATHVRV